MIGDILQPTHLLFILVVALLVLGPKRLPEVGRALGRGLRDFRNALNTDELHEHMLSSTQTTEIQHDPVAPTEAPVSIQHDPVAPTEAPVPTDPMATSATSNHSDQDASESDTSQETVVSTPAPDRVP